MPGLIFISWSKFVTQTNLLVLILNSHVQYVVNISYSTIMYYCINVFITCKYFITAKIVEFVIIYSSSLMNIHEFVIIYSSRLRPIVFVYKACSTFDQKTYG